MNEKSGRTKYIKLLFHKREKAIKDKIESKIKKIEMNGNRVYSNSRDQFLKEELRKMNLFSRLMLLRTVLREWSRYVKKKKEDRLLGRSPSLTPHSVSFSNSLYSRDGDEMGLRISNIVEERRRTSHQVIGKNQIFPMAPRTSLDAKRMSC